MVSRLVFSSSGSYVISNPSGLELAQKEVLLSTVFNWELCNDWAKHNGRISGLVCIMLEAFGVSAQILNSELEFQLAGIILYKSDWISGLNDELSGCRHLVC